MHTIYLALGSNVGDRIQYIQSAISFLEEKVHIQKQANIYESKAYGVTDQDNFLNTVVEATTKLTPCELLSFVKDIEQRVGRIERFHWGPREIDIDILFYDDLVYKDEALEIPHTQIQERDFVLIPLCDINPNFIHPVLNQTIASLSKGLSDISHQNILFSQ